MQISRLEELDLLPNFDINIFDNEQNEKSDGRFFPMTDSEVYNLIETEENANTKKKRVVLIIHRFLYNKQNIICL